MKIFGLDWRDVLARLPEWEALSPGARGAFLKIKPSQGISAPELGELRAELEAAGMVTSTAKRAVAAPEYHALLVALRAMLRAAGVDVLRAGLPDRYLEEHFTDEELRVITGRPRMSYGWVDRERIAQEASSVDWVGEFLALEDAAAARKWEAPRLIRGEAPRFDAHGRWKALQELVRSLTEHPKGVPLRDLGAFLPGLDDGERAAVLEAGIRYLLLVPRIRPEEPDAVVGLVPAVAERFGPPPPPPAPVEPAEEFEAPYLVGDMTTVLVEALTAPIPVRQDGGIFVRAQKLLAQRLQAIPGWVWRALGVWDDPGEMEENEAREQAAELLAGRVTEAAGTLLTFGLTRIEADPDGKYQIAVTEKGERWLALPEEGRVRELVDVLRASRQRIPLGWYGTDTGREFFPMRIAFDLRPDVLDLRAALQDAFLAIPAGKMVPWDEFFTYHALAANPFLAHEPAKLVVSSGFGAVRSLTREIWQQLWARLLEEFMGARLLPFGGLRVGTTADGRACVGLTSVGRYLLGGTDEWTYAPPPAGEVVVQPDFEILFLAPSPRLEPELARIADRIGSGIGALFRITRASVLRAAEQGMSADEALGLLEGVSRSGVPANVARQVRDWMGATRRVSLHTMLLIECPDAETAVRVLGLTSGYGEQITPTIIRLPTHALDRKAFLKKLRERGIFVTI